MPELPEVETIARALRDGGGVKRGGAALPGRTIQGAQLFWERSLAEPLPDTFLARIKGQTVMSIGRRAKFLSIQLTSDTLLVHLRMSGDLRVESRGKRAAAA